jgi:transcriptional regulator GlxA family with amidase domain
VRETQPVSPSVAIPLIRAAYDEGREELQDRWATLIASAMDPARSSRVRLSFIETLRQFDPLDAVVLKTYTEIPGIENNNDNISELIRRVAKSDDEFWLSVENLQRLNCVPSNSMSPRRILISRYGRALISAVTD